MADERLRDLERRAAQTGAIEDQARLLLERVRVGNLDREMLYLAAHCGHPAAQAATKTTTMPMWQFKEWLNMFQQWDKEVCIRAALALRHEIITTFYRSFPDETILGATIQAVRAWVIYSYARDQSEVTEIADQASDAFDRIEQATELPWSIEQEQAFAAAHAAMMITEAVAMRPVFHHTYDEEELKQRPSEDRLDVTALRDTVRFGLMVINEDILRQRICDELIPWALDESDPLRSNQE